MLKKITLKNYMAHALTVIEPAAPGLTVLIGPNNCGKSAVVSALQTLCGNEKGGYMVRHEESDCRVIVETDDGHSIEWCRKKGTPSYVLDGDAVHRVKSDVLDQIQEVLRLPKVIPSEAPDAAERREAFDIHFATQKSPIFLLDEPPSRAALFFASASDAALLVEMQKKHRLKVQKANERKIHLERELRDADLVLAALDPVAELTRLLHEAERQFEAIQAAARDSAKLQALVEQLAAQHSAYERCSAVVTCIGSLAPPPKQTDTSALTDLIGALSNYSGARELFLAQTQTLGAIQTAPLLQDAGALRSLCEQLTEQERAFDINARRAERLAALDGAPELADTAELAQLVAEVDAAQQRLAVHAHTSETLRTLATFPEPPEISALDEIVGEWSQLEDQLAGTRREVKALEDEQQAVKDQIRAWAARHPTCPTCGGAVDSETILLNQDHSHAE